jgi:hypothetical protein
MQCFIDVREPADNGYAGNRDDDAGQQAGRQCSGNVLLKFARFNRTNHIRLDDGLLFFANVGSSRLPRSSALSSAGMLLP